MMAFAAFTMAKPTKIENATLPPGHKLKRYIIIKKLSAGGFGVVYLATRTDDGCVVALKEFLPSIIKCRQSGQGPNIYCDVDSDVPRFNDGLATFFREADILAQVHNPRIIPIWDVFRENGTAYFAMPVERGGTLQSLIKLRKEFISEALLRHLFIDACLGVEALHDRNLLHLDIKPSNLWVRPDRSVVVLDLGASRWDDDELKSARLARTPGFAAPEQHSEYRVRGVGVRTDVYGLCASMMACIDGQPPQAATERRSFLPPPTARRYGQYSGDLLAEITRGMDLMPPFRHASVHELRSNLEKLQRLSVNPARPMTETVSLF